MRINFLNLFLLSVFLQLHCNINDVEDIPFDINIELMRADIEKRNQYMIDEDDKFCCQSVLDYFKWGYELSIRVTVSSELNEELSIILNYFNHINSSQTNFISIDNGNIEYVCQNEYLDISKLCDLGSHLTLKEGEYNFIMRIKFGECEINNGYLMIRFPIQPINSIGNHKRFEYIDKWITNALFFPVKNGKVSVKPLYNHPELLYLKSGNFIENEYYKKD